MVKNYLSRSCLNVFSNLQLACRERRSITHALLQAAVPMRFITAGCKPTKQEYRTEWPGCSDNGVLKCFLCETQLLQQSRAYFSDLIFHKCSMHLNHLNVLTFSSAKRALATVLRTFVDNSPRSRPAITEMDTLLWRPRKPLYPKNHRVLCARVFSPVNSSACELLHFPTT